MLNQGSRLFFYLQRTIFYRYRMSDRNFKINLQGSLTNGNFCFLLLCFENNEEHRDFGLTCETWRKCRTNERVSDFIVYEVSLKGMKQNQVFKQNSSFPFIFSGLRESSSRSLYYNKKDKETLKRPRRNEILWKLSST